MFQDMIIPTSAIGGFTQTSTGFTPIGTIISVMGNTAPTNYLVCDGTIYNIADFVELSDYFYEQFGACNYFGGDGETTFAVPDLRGEFLRGTGENSHETTYAGSTLKQGDGKAVGEHQDATVHVAVYTTEGNIIARKQNSTTGLNVYGPDSNVTSGTYAKVASTNGSSTHIAGYTSRPTNTSVLYCIAYKNIYLDTKIDYSTDEKVIGNWIDGSTIYQKTLQVTSPSTINTNTNIVNLSDYNIEIVINIEGSIVKSASDYLPINFHNNGSSDYFCTWYQDMYLKMATGSSGLLSKTVYITIQYTKTS